MATTTMTMAKALNEGLRRAMEKNKKVLIMGEDVGKLGGVFRVTDGLQKDFGEDRVIDAPLAESAIVGTAVGLAIRGYRTVCEIQFDGLVYPAFDQIVSQVAKLHKRSDGVYTMGLVIRIPFQEGIDAIVRREGTDVTVIGYGSSVKTILRAADTAAVEGTSLEVVDARSIAPLELDTMVKSLEKTGRLVVVQEAPHMASIGSEIVAELSERCFYSLRAPGVRVSGYHVPYPPSRIEEDYRPTVDRILDAVDRVMGYES